MAYFFMQTVYLMDRIMDCGLLQISSRSEDLDPIKNKPRNIWATYDMSQNNGQRLNCCSLLTSLIPCGLQSDKTGQPKKSTHLHEMVTLVACSNYQIQMVFSTGNLIPKMSIST